MGIDALREVIHAQPFKPFNIVLANGERLLAHHPEFIFAPPGERTAWLVGPGPENPHDRRGLGGETGA